MLNVLEDIAATEIDFSGVSGEQLHLIDKV